MGSPHHKYLAVVISIKHLTDVILSSFFVRKVK